MKKFLEFCLVACVSWYGITTGTPAFGTEKKMTKQEKAVVAIKLEMQRSKERGVCMYDSKRSDMPRIGSKKWHKVNPNL